MGKARLAFATLTAVIVACTAAPTAVAPSAPAPAASAPAAPTEWSTLPVAELNGLALECINGVEQSGDRYVLRSSGDGFAGGPTRLRPWIEARGDFGVYATIGGDTGQPADLTLYGALAQGPEFWRGVKRLDVGLRTGRLAFSAYTGEKADPAVSSSFPTSAARPAKVGLRKVGSELVFRVNGEEVGRVPDPGLFASGVVHLGLTVGPRTTMTVDDLAVEAPPGGAGAVTVVPGFLDQPPAGTSLRSLAAARSFRIGAHTDGIAADPAVDGFLMDPQSRRTLAREYNHLTVGVWPVATSPARDRYDFCTSDAEVAFGRAHGMAMRVQSLIYGPPKWLTAGTFTRDQLLDWMHGYIQTVMGRYRGKIGDWEVTNELFSFMPKDCTWNTTDSNNAPYVKALGQDWVDQVFRWAREADPQARLYYNENHAEGGGLKSDCVYALVKGMKERGVPIDGVGLQSHFSLPDAKRGAFSEPPTPTSVAANMKRYADIGVSVQITEIDVRVGKDAGSAQLDAQARVYADMLRTCLAATNCTAFTSWGVSDRYSWIRAKQFGGEVWEKPLPFDDDFKPKPAYAAMLEALRK